MKKIRFIISTVMAVAASFAFAVKVFADETEAASGTTAADGASSLFGDNSILPFILMIAVFGLLAYFLIIRPDKKRRKEADDLRSGLKVGDNVTTIGGIIGTVVSVGDDTFTLNNGLKFKKTAVYSVDDRDVDLDEDDDDDDEEESTEKK